LKADKGCLEEAAKPDSCNHRVDDFFSAKIVMVAVALAYATQRTNRKTHPEEVLSSMIIKPMPSVKMRYATHMTARYCPVRDTSTPETADVKAHPKE